MGKQKWKDFLYLNVGTLLMVMGIYFFKFPNNFSTGGVTGIAIIIDAFLPGISPGALVFIINMALLLVGFLLLGKDFGVKTVYASTLMSVGLWVMERVYPMARPFTDQPLLELLFAVGLPAFGSALLFNMDASTGGTDIVAMLLKKYTSINIGRSLMFTDLIITLSAFFVFGIRTGLFSLLGLIIKTTLIDTVIESLNMCKCFNIICENPQPICDYITKTLDRSATVTKGMGAFTKEERYIIYTAMNRGQAVQLQRFIKSNEPHAFISISNTSEIIGKGFRGQ